VCAGAGEPATRACGTPLNLVLYLAGHLAEASDCLNLSTDGLYDRFFGWVHGRQAGTRGR
jgi:hypothetical protein